MASTFSVICSLRPVVKVFQPLERLIDGAPDFTANRKPPEATHRASRGCGVLEKFGGASPFNISMTRSSVKSGALVFSVDFLPMRKARTAFDTRKSVAPPQVRFFQHAV